MHACNPDLPEPIDVSGDRYTAFLWQRQIITFRGDGTYEMLSPEITVKSTIEAQELRENKIILDGGRLYDPIVVENRLVMTNDNEEQALSYTVENGLLAFSVDGMEACLIPQDDRTLAMTAARGIFIPIE